MTRRRQVHELVSVVDPRINVALDPTYGAPHTDEFSVALDREIAPAIESVGGLHPEAGSRFHRLGRQAAASTRQTSNVARNGRARSSR